MTISDRQAPVLIGVGEASGQSLRQGLGIEWPSPVDLASAAAKAALADSGVADKLGASIDCLLAIRLFHDSGVQHAYGSPDNFPDAIAQAADLNPAQLIYGDVGGQSPQKHINELAVQLHEGKIKAALLCGSESIGTVKRAKKAGHAMDWNQPSDRDFIDKRTEFPVLTMYEFRHGIISMPMAYGLLENARRSRLNMDRASYATDMAELWSAFSSVASTREHAQFAKDWSAEELLQDGSGNYQLNDPYRRWMVAQDAVALGAAVIMTTAGHAEDLGIAEDKMIYLHSGADASVPIISQQMDLSRSPAVEWAVGKALDLAEQQASDIGPIDIYSCFPVAVSLVMEALNQPDRPLSSYTLTGGLSFFGGPGNSYSTHAIVALVQALRKDGSKPGMISANGGAINKESVGIYAAQPLAGGWSPDRIATPNALPPDEGTKPDHFASGSGVIKSYALPYVKGVAGAATLWLADENDVPCIGLLENPPKDTDLIGERVTISTDGKRNHAVLQ
ncbi:acetyl-CoA acetyltransferase [Parasphingorhabdus litoris]|uniref:Acetyl-CoA acetyltransferase n=1 Tax=Parasphingorhabdus litoris TaxID=394733 RepID=A0ABN1AKG0_9SPHN|nr:hypothetical protein [Parasphingorhabdus litoris]